MSQSQDSSWSTRAPEPEFLTTHCNLHLCLKIYQFQIVEVHSVPFDLHGVVTECHSYIVCPEGIQKVSSHVI